MILFDTNAVNLLPHDGPRADIIRKLRQSGHHRVAVPWMVLEEMAAHQAKHYPAKYEAAVNTLEKLREVLPWELKSTLEPLNVERLMDHWRELYGDIFEVIETSGEIARRALAREALALPPAKRAGDRSEGARDVAIWFSILEFLEKNPEEQICFVTNNTKDFGDGVTYPYPMNEDVAKLQNRLTRLSNFDEVVSTFTKTVSGKEAEGAADQLLRSLPVRSRVAQTAVEVLASTSGFAGLGSTGSVEWRGWFASPEVDLLSVTNVTGHEIEGDIWYTANARWVLYGLAFHGDESEPSCTACVWETKVLFSARDGDETPTLLTPKEPEAPDGSDPAIMEILKRLKSRATGVTRRAMQEWRQAGFVAEGALSKQFLESLDIAGPLRRSYAEMFSTTNAALAKALADAYPKPDLVGLNRSLVEHLRPQVDLTAALANALPKLDIAGMLPQFDFTGLTGITAGPYDDDEGNKEDEVDGQMSFEDAADDEHDGEDGVADPGGED
ncbi:PIN domain-containing protein [Streptomyces globisporus]|uniref:PIN domain-containing protein n=1 Tax=Streptomyces globisporus TaxID=1908 RepID=UPI00378F47DB